MLQQVLPKYLLLLFELQSRVLSSRLLILSCNTLFFIFSFISACCVPLLSSAPRYLCTSSFSRFLITVFRSSITDVVPVNFPLLKLLYYSHYSPMSHFWEKLITDLLTYWHTDPQTYWHTDPQTMVLLLLLLLLLSDYITNCFNSVFMLLMSSNSKSP